MVGVSFTFMKQMITFNLKEVYNEKKAELEAGHKETKEELKEKLAKEKREVGEDCQQSITTLEERLLSSDS